MGTIIVLVMKKVVLGLIVNEN